MAINAMVVSTSTLLSGAMMIGYYTGVGDFIGCNVFIFMLYPTVLIFLTFLVMSLDKAIAITFPFKHHELMKPRVVCGILVANHLLVVMIYARNLFASRSFTKVAQFGICIMHDPAILKAVMSHYQYFYLLLSQSLWMSTSLSKPNKFVKRYKKRASYQEVTVGIMINLKH